VTRNEERARRADEAIAVYASRYSPQEKPDPDAWEEVLTDFITDAMHLLGRDAVRDSLRMAEIHHQAEIEEEGGAK